MAPIYRSCTILSEMIVYLVIVFIAIIATLTIFSKKYRKEMKQKEDQRLSSSIEHAAGEPPANTASDPTKFSPVDKKVSDISRERRRLAQACT